MQKATVQNKTLTLVPLPSRSNVFSLQQSCFMVPSDYPCPLVKSVGMSISIGHQSLVNYLLANGHTCFCEQAKDTQFRFTVEPGSICVHCTASFTDPIRVNEYHNGQPSSTPSADTGFFFFSLQAHSCMKTDVFFCTKLRKKKYCSCK